MASDEEPISPAVAGLRASSQGTSGQQQTREARWRTAGACLIVALGAAAVVLVLFAPRFALWRALDVHAISARPEYGRAAVTLDQVADPWATPDTLLHRVLRWRLFFPVLWHYLPLPTWLLFAMPFAGCVAVLWLVCWLTLERVHSLTAAVLATFAFAALPWFFVSTGWLLYFDSWLVLGMLVVAFVPSRFVVAAACLATPWIDERFVLALPVTIIVRAVALDRRAVAVWRDFLYDLATVALASLPYLAVRGLAWLGGEPTTADYIHSHYAEVREVSWTRLIDGLWSGFRIEWVFVVVAIWLTGRRAGWSWAVVLAIVVILSAGSSLYIAADMSRNLMAISPVLLLGIWLWESWRANLLGWVLPGVVVAGALLPAAHVMWDQKIAIRYLPAEIDSWRHPPLFLAVEELAYESRSLAAAGRLEEAVDVARRAVQLSPDDAVGHVALGAALQQLGDRDGFREGQLEEIVAEFREVLRLNPALVGAHDSLAAAYMAAHRPEEAIEQLRLAPASEATKLLNCLRMANALAAAGRAAEATACYAQALAQDSRSSEAHYGLALLLVNSGQADEAVAHLRAALDANSQLERVSS